MRIIQLAYIVNQISKEIHLHFYADTMAKATTSFVVQRLRNHHLSENQLKTSLGTS